MKNYFSKNKIKIILGITCLVWILTKIICYKLWTSERLFPLIPVFEFLDELPNSIHLFLFISSCFCLLLIPFYSKNHLLLISALILEISSCLLDQNRWMPWNYQFFLTLLFFVFYNKNYKQFLNFFSFLIASIYIYSGLHKINGGFLYNVWERMILNRFFGFDYSQINQTWIHYSGLILGLIEFLAGIGILFLKNKKIVSILLIGMHLFILMLISPFGFNYNSSVWPWNVVMILFLYLLYLNENYNHISFKSLTTGWNKIPFVVIGILPILNYIGIWDDYLSFKLYSGNTLQMEICIPKEEVPSEYTPYLITNSRFCKDCKVLNVGRLAMNEVNSVVYPEKRIYVAMIKKWKKKYPKSKATFCIYKFPYQQKDIQILN